MPVPETSPPAEPVPAEPAAKRPARKGKPPPQENTLGALTAAPTGHGRKKAKEKPAGKSDEKPAKPPSKKRTEPLNFRVTAEFRRAFKRAAAAEDCKKVELLERLFEAWSARPPA